MALRQIPLCFLLLVYPLLGIGRAQEPAPGDAVSSASSAVSSDDIRVADGLQLPGYGHAWMLDNWQGVAELVELRPVMPSDRGISLKLHRTIEIPGEQAAVRSHVGALQIFIREAGAIYESGNDGGLARPQFAVVQLRAIHGRREASKGALEAVAALAKGNAAASSEVFELKQQRVGDTGWSRLTLAQALTPGEYALVPLPGSSAAALDEVYGFAVDPQAPENSRALRSERDRNMNP